MSLKLCMRRIFILKKIYKRVWEIGEHAYFRVYIMYIAEDVGDKNIRPCSILSPSFRIIFPNL